MLFVQNKSVAIRIKFNKMKFFIGEASSTIFFLFLQYFLVHVFFCVIYIFFIYLFSN